ncbi:MAG: prolipoprotein diacylglyceryl transferase [Gammaproteobacteria bacterium]|nr:prolipoprotein diacylglyceryl transferase [Gammaproteobacteria bacterium]
MLVHPDIDPVAFALPAFTVFGHTVHLQVHWYGLMYLLGFYGFWWLGTRRARYPHVNWPHERVGDLLFYAVLGVILGGRLGYTLFYAYTPDGRWLEALDPTYVFKVWDGGMSFHGGLIGVIVAMIVFARQRGLPFWEVADFAAVITPFGLFTGRIGNFINGELWGKVTSLPWGMVFQEAHDGLPHHPSQLYEAALEGLGLLTLLWWFGRSPRPRMAISGLFLLGYGCIRFGLEFVRLPDPQFGYLLWGWVTMGQVLSLPMIACGLLFLYWSYRRGAGTAGAG